MLSSGSARPRAATSFAKLLLAFPSTYSMVRPRARNEAPIILSRASRQLPPQVPTRRTFP